MSFSSFRVLVIMLFATAKGWSADPVLPKDEPLRLAADVRAIFEAKCLDCHGPEIPRPKGKFGYILDLNRVAANPKYVVPGKPESSDLYDLVFHDEMPGEDANVPPLTKDEKEKVRRWIEMGAPSDLPRGMEKDLPAGGVVIASARVSEPGWKRALRWIGKFHPVSTHFPVALMLVAVLAEAIGWWTRRESWMQTVRFLVVLAALGGVAAAGLGWMNAYFSSYDKAPGTLLWWHRWLGSATSAWALICAGLVCLSPCPEGTRERRRFRGALMLGASLVAVSGFLGSVLIYGWEHYAWN